MGGDAVAVLVHAIEARELKPKNSSMMIDPILSIETLGETQVSPKFKQDLAPYFNHTFHVESEKVVDFQGEVLVVSVFDTGTLFRKELIGSFSFELEDVYRQPNHEYFRVWALLTSPDKAGKSSVRGYLKLSVAVLKPGDVPAQHDEAEEEEGDDQEEDLSKMVLLKPKGMEGVDNILRAKFFHAEDLPKMDTFGKADPFVEVRYGTNKNKTSIVKNNLSPDWYEELHIPVILPSVADNVVVKLFDFDAGADPELIGQKVLSLKEIQTPLSSGSKNWAAPQWLNFYRGQGSHGETTDYAGRALASFSLTPAEAKLGLVKISPEAEPTTNTYTISFDLFEIQGLSKSSNSFYVVISIGSHKVSSSKKKPLDGEHGLVEFYENLPDLDAPFPVDTTQVPDVFIYVYEDTPGDDKRIGYLRYTYEQFSKLGTAPRWEPLRRKSSSKDDENFAGAIQFKASISTLRPQRVKISKPVKKPYQLRAHIYLGSNLPAGDEDALSDPYVVISFGGAKGKTKTIDHTIYPDWYETIVLDVDVAEAYAPDIQLIVYDHDTVSADEFLGRVSVPLPKSSAAQNIVDPQWYRLSLRDQVPGRGEILASFQLLPQDQKSAPLPQLRPRLIDTEIEIGVIGLRNLTPFRLIPVSDPYIKFSVSGAKHSVLTKKIKHQNNNPNFFENIKIPAALPENGLFLPALLIEVFDTRALKDVMVGTASIPLSSFAPWVPQDKKAAAKYVDLPPVVKEEEFYQPPVEVVTSVPLPAAIKVEAAVEIDIHETVSDETSSLLGKGKSKSLQEIPLVSRQAIPDTTVAGTEEEPEPPQAPQLPTEVEHNLKKFPFVEIDLFRGTSKGISSGNLFNRPDTVVGRFKGAVSVRPLSGSSSKKQESKAVDVTQLAKTRPFVLRVYVETGHNLVPHDDNGFSDPYLRLTTGKQFIKDLENVKVHTLQPEYYKLHTIFGNLPEENELKIQLYDKDDVGADEFMGETKYDLEMLWFSDEWRKLNPKPKEFRTLWSSFSSFPHYCCRNGRGTRAPTGSPTPH